MRTLIAAITCATAALLPTTANASTNPQPTGVQQLLHKAVTEQGYPGMIAEVRDGGRRWFGTAGVADLETGRKRRPQDRFRVGSITKMFTTTVVLQLAAERRLSLDDTVDRWLPGLIQGNGHDGTKTTIRHLLSHRSGIFAYTSDQDLLRRYFTPALLEHRYDQWTPDQLVKIAMANPADHAPGEDWTYSNSNFLLAAMIVERVTGRPYGEQIERRVIRPLGLTGTYVPGQSTVIRGPHGRQYSKLSQQGPDAKIYDLTDLNASVGYGAGEMVSTASDLNTFYSALMGGRLFPQAQLRQMLTMTRVPDGKWMDGYSYGLGISSVTLSCGTEVYGHGGFIYGTWSYTYGTRDGKHVVTQNLNGDWGAPTQGIFTEILEATFC